MKGLILNNLYTVEKGIKSSIGLTILAISLLLFTQNPVALRVAAFLPFLLIPVNAFEVLKHDDKSGWSKFELTLPVERHKIIQSKYITFVLLFSMSLVLTFVLFYFVHTFLYPTFTNTFFNFLLRGMGGILAIAALHYPLTYLLGTEKSDTITISSMGFCFGMFFIVFMLLELVIGTVDGFDGIFSVTFFAVSIVLFIVSYFVSYMIYKNKEF
ncbi:ABC-type transport system involved in multi-copper enzyme maturation permease subunit [Cerasibacillus quisquiliarum]|uniref:Membrane protein n=1 Tax=Cerasibacillus quisquiliarum TaxID=227865 RepID=A0A511UT86_9BACI|nr:ABC-2 transporter permease [Cerasibacillus quisquiliarum]MBB5145299.1 ABC-type transport system involved in multi-copper enzyme maturation permease subunit [Cerasibacillus quisquiliarum]GEN29809.1 membrane protein [Cerasibacillus quisquiliarum]